MAVEQERTPRLGRLFAAITALACVGAAGLGAEMAFAARGWSAPDRVSEKGESPKGPAIAGNERRFAVAAWYRFENNGQDITVRTAKRLRKGSFKPPETLGPADPSIGPNPATFPSVAVDRLGDTVVTWVRKDSDGKMRVMAAHRPKKGEFSDPDKLSPAGVHSFQAKVAVNAAGDAVAVWQTFDSGKFEVQAASMAADGQHFGDPVTLSPTDVDAQFPQVAFSATGRVVVAWAAKPRRSDTKSVQATSRQPGESFGEAQTLSGDDLDASRPQLAVAGDGSAIVAWNESGDTSIDHVAAAYAPPAASFQSPQVLPSQPDHAGINPRVGMDGDGHATVLWSEAPAPGKDVPYLERGALSGTDGSLGDAQTLYRNHGGLIEQALAVNDANGAAAAWTTDTDKGPTPIRSVTRPSTSSTFGDVEQLTLPGASGAATTLAAAADSATALWVAMNGPRPSAIYASRHRIP